MFGRYWGNSVGTAEALTDDQGVVRLRERTLPPTANFSTPPPGLGMEASPFQVLKAPREWRRRTEATPRRAAISGFGFGGVNAHVLLEEYDGRIPTRSASEGKGSEPSPSLALRVGVDAPAIAVVGMDARFGPWDSLRSFQERVLGGRAVEPRPPRHDWGVLESAWVRREGLDAPSLAGFYVEELRVAADRFRIPPRELQEALPQQVLMLLAADAALAGVKLADQTRPRTGVFIGLGLDLNTTNFHFRWWVLKHAEEWAERLGLAPSSPEYAAWKRELIEATGPPLNANRVMGALGSIAASRIARAFHLGGPSFTLSSGDTSGLRAVAAAVRALQRGELDAALAGAVDLPGDVRALLAARAKRRTAGEGAAAVVLKRLDDAVRDGDTVYAVVKDVGDAESLEILESADGDVGHTGAASGMAALVKAVLGLHRQLLPPSEGRPARPWLRDRIDGPRRAAVRAGEEGGRVHLLLEEWDAEACVDRPERLQPLGASDEALFVIEGGDAGTLARGLDRLRSLLDSPDHGIEADARAWFRDHPGAADDPLAVAFVAQDRIELRGQIEWARRGLAERTTPPPAFRDRVFFTPRPLGPSGKIAFVYPGSGNDYPGMGRELAVQWPELLRRQDAENERLCSQFVSSIFWDETSRRTPDARQRIFGQVALGGLTTDLVRMFGVQPDAAVGYSLGESAALFALRAWAGRDLMLRAMNESTLFAGDLTGRCDAARKAWKLPPEAPVEWTAGLVVDRPVEEVRAALAGVERAYLLIINTPRECVVGGDRAAVEEVGRRLGRAPLPLPETSTVHCPVAREVAEAYRRLHRLPTTPPPRCALSQRRPWPRLRIDGGQRRRRHPAQALDTVDFPAVIEAAYRDGVRQFLEMGPGASCTRMIGAVLGDRPHRARSVCAPARTEFPPCCGCWECSSPSVWPWTCGRSTAGKLRRRSGLMGWRPVGRWSSPSAGKRLRRRSRRRKSRRRSLRASWRRC